MIVVAAAGNQGSVGGTIITRHPWVIPVAACDAQGRPTRESNLGHSMGLRGLSAPGEAIASLGVDGKPLTLGGTSVAAPFVTGAVALLWSEFPAASAAEVKAAVTQAIAGRRTTVTPPLLNAWAAYGLMNSERDKEVCVMTGKEGDNRQSERPAHRVHLPGFVTDEDIGLGDVVKRMTYAVGIRPCGGCEGRAAALNSWMTFSGRRGR